MTRLAVRSGPHARHTGVAAPLGAAPRAARRGIAGSGAAAYLTLGPGRRAGAIPAEPFGSMVLGQQTGNTALALLLLVTGSLVPSRGSRTAVRSRVRVRRRGVVGTRPTGTDEPQDRSQFRFPTSAHQGGHHGPRSRAATCRPAPVLRSDEHLCRNAHGSRSRAGSCTPSSAAPSSRRIARGRRRPGPDHAAP